MDSCQEQYSNIKIPARGKYLPHLIQDLIEVEQMFKKIKRQTSLNCSINSFISERQGVCQSKITLVFAELSAGYLAIES